jgi:hypothetical protein
MIGVISSKNLCLSGIAIPPLQRRSLHRDGKVIDFATFAGTNETIFGFIISSWAVCALSIERAARPFVLDSCRPKPAALRGTTLPSDRESSREPKRKTAQKTRQGGRSKDMGAALRSVYEKTVSEAIPNEMLDLLGKLG